MMRRCLLLWKNLGVAWSVEGIDLQCWHSTSPTPYIIWFRRFWLDVRHQSAGEFLTFSWSCALDASFKDLGLLSILIQSRARRLIKQSLLLYEQSGSERIDQGSCVWNGTTRYSLRQHRPKLLCHWDGYWSYKRYQIHPLCFWTNSQCSAGVSKMRQLEPLYFCLSNPHPTSIEPWSSSIEACLVRF